MADEFSLNDPETRAYVIEILSDLQKSAAFGDTADFSSYFNELATYLGDRGLDASQETFDVPEDAATPANNMLAYFDYLHTLPKEYSGSSKVVLHDTVPDSHPYFPGPDMGAPRPSGYRTNTALRLSDIQLADSCVEFLEEKPTFDEDEVRKLWEDHWDPVGSNDYSLNQRDPIVDIVLNEAEADGVTLYTPYTEAITAQGVRPMAFPKMADVMDKYLDLEIFADDFRERRKAAAIVGIYLLENEKQSADEYNPFMEIVERKFASPLAEQGSLIAAGTHSGFVGMKTPDEVVKTLQTQLVSRPSEEEAKQIFYDVASAMDAYARTYEQQKVAQGEFEENPLRTVYGCEVEMFRPQSRDYLMDELEKSLGVQSPERASRKRLEAEAASMIGVITPEQNTSSMDYA